MTTPGPAGTNLIIDVTVHDNKTMTRHHVSKRGILTFHNDSEQQLVVTCTSNQSPFLDGGCGNPTNEFSVPAGGSRSVRIVDTIDFGQSFVYSAKIGNTEAEDPIVIVDRY